MSRPWGCSRDNCISTVLARTAGWPYSDLIALSARRSGMNRFQVICSTIFLLLSGLAMIIAVILGVSQGVLASLTMDLDSLRILLMIYASYPLFILLLLWPGNKSRVECWLLGTGGLLILGCSVYSWTLVAVADPGAIPALVMVWYGMLQTAVVAGLFIILAMTRLWHYRQAATTE
jgi:hypothetical protein